MGLKSNNYHDLRNCGVRITPTIKGVKDATGSGVLYVTTNLVNYDYVITAKHILQESTNVSFCATSLSGIEISRSVGKSFESFHEIRKSEISDNVIIFDGDIAIIKVDKRGEYNFPPILVSEEPDAGENDFVVWGTFAAAKMEQIHKVKVEGSEPSYGRYQLVNNFKPNDLKGISGAGLFHASKPCLYGIISAFPNENLANQTLDVAEISFNEINRKLQSLGLVTLSTEESECIFRSY